MGEDALARDSLAEVRRTSPGFSIEQALVVAVHKRDTRPILLLDGLRKAGLRE
jgi:hypothetical protein